MGKNVFSNNKGFALVETLIVAVAVMVIFSIMYANFYPLVGEYEKTNNYDSVDSKYKGYWIRRMLQESTTPNQFVLNACNYSGVNRCRIITDCNFMTSDSDKNYCNNLFSSLGIKKVYITESNIKNFKAYAKANLDTDRQLQEYINYLPTFESVDSQCSNYRLIFEYEKNPDDDTDPTRLFGTIGVKK